VQLSGTLAIKNHPTNLEHFTSSVPRGQVFAGAPNVIAGVGGELRLGSWAALVPQLQLPLTAAPVRYGMIFGLGVRAVIE
jgi:hypothetical protein